MYSYRHSKSNFKKGLKLKPSKLAEKKRRVLAWQAVLIAVVLVVFIFGFSLLAQSSFLAVKSVSVNGAVSIPAKDIVGIADAEMSGGYFFGLIPKTNFLFFPKSAIRSAVLGAYKKLSDVKAVSDWQGAVVVSVSERMPVGSWCEQPVIGASAAGESGAAVLASADSGQNRGLSSCYFLDANGYIFESASSTASSANSSADSFITYFGALNSADPLGANFLGAGKFGNLNSIIGILQKSGVSVKSVSIDADLNVSAEMPAGGKIIFSLNQDSSKISENLPLILNALNGGSSATTGLSAGVPTFSGASKIDYIDLRFGNKIFYKPK